MRYNFNSGYGQALLNNIAGQVPALGRVFLVLNSANTDEQNYLMANDILKPDPEGQIRVFTTLEGAYAAVESNNNDVILLDGNSSHALAAGIAWTKNRVHVFGLDGGGRSVQQGAKISTVAADDTGYVLKVTGVRNTFRNIKLIQNSTDAAGLTCLQCGGEGNLYENVSATFGVVTRLGGTTTYEVVMGEDSGTFINCQFGQDTLLTSAARKVMIIDQVTASQECKSNKFIDCTWLISSSDSDAELIGMAAAGDVLFTNHFIRPSLIASIDSAGGAAIDSAVSTANGLTKGTLNFSYPMVHGCTDFGTNGTNNDGLWVVAPLNVATDIVAFQPVAT